MLRQSFKTAAVLALLATPVLTPARAQGADPFPPGDGHDVVVKACTQCHAAELVTNTGKSREEWSTTVSTMIGNGAPVSDAEFGKVVDYLAKNYPPK
jgi:mono/diheme cytochrome c family protein